MKYQKPYIKDLSELTFAEGACASGQFVGVCTAIAGGLAGNCQGTGSNAGDCNATGSNVHTSCDANGIAGVAPNCSPHGGFADPSV